MQPGATSTTLAITYREFSDDGVWVITGREGAADSGQHAGWLRAQAVIAPSSESTLIGSATQIPAVTEIQ